jgi:hypothetical protein
VSTDSRSITQADENSRFQMNGDPNDHERVRNRGARFRMNATPTGFEHLRLFAA